MIRGGANKAWHIRRCQKRTRSREQARRRAPFRSCHVRLPAGSGPPCGVDLALSL